MSSSWSLDTSGIDEEIETILATAKAVKEACTETLETIGDDTKKNLVSNMSRAFKNVTPVKSGVRVSKVYETSSGDVKVFVGFFSYYTFNEGDAKERIVPIPLMAYAREFGTSRGEKSVKFIKKSYPKRSQLDNLLQTKLNEKGLGE